MLCLPELFDDDDDNDSGIGSPPPSPGYDDDNDSGLGGDSPPPSPGGVLSHSSEATTLTEGELIITQPMSVILVFIQTLL